MRIQVNAHSSVDGSDTLIEVIEATVQAGLDRYGDRLTCVEAHLSEQYRTKSKDTCLLEARPIGMKPVVATGTGETIELACHDATQKIQSLLNRIFGTNRRRLLRRNHPSEPLLTRCVSAVYTVSRAEEQRLKSELGRIGDSPSRRAALFTDVKTRLGSSVASQLWWSAFAAQDTPET
jgi:hypothetical protein